MGLILAVRRLGQCGALASCAALIACGGRADQDEGGNQGGSSGGIGEVSGGQPVSNAAGASPGGAHSQGGSSGSTGASSAGGALEMSGGSSGSSGRSGTWTVTESDIRPACHAELAECGGVSFVAESFEPSSAPINSCAIPLPLPLEAPNRINLVVDCVVLPKDDPAAGWELQSIENVIVLKGENCERVVNGELNRVSVYYGCGSLL